MASNVVVENNTFIVDNKNEEVEKWWIKRMNKMEFVAVIIIGILILSGAQFGMNFILSHIVQCRFHDILPPVSQKAFHFFNLQTSV